MDSPARSTFLINKNKFVTRSTRRCCVVGCFNTERKNPELQFYRFPGQSYEKERKKNWIRAVRRASETNKYKLWEPTDNSRICSAHFEGGERSNDPTKVSYNPTIFPEVYGKKPIDEARKARLEARNKRKAEESIVIDDEVNDENSTYDNIIDQVDNVETLDAVEELFKEIGVQTDPVSDCDTSENFTSLFCSLHNNEASTQTTITRRTKPPTIKKVILSEENVREFLNEIEEKKCKKTADKRCGSDLEMQVSFSGFESIMSDESMKSLGGVSLLFFNILLEFIKPGQEGQPHFYRKLSRHNRLLLFLMKLKLGISFSSLGHIFNIKRQTVSVIFFSVLDTLIANTKGWLFWPLKEAIKETMPITFKNYPNCRAIIDCTELACDTPPKVEQRILMYSNYKSGFTIKYLIVISPSGMITFISKGYSGRATDSFITNDSGFLNLLEPGDEVMADKGFPQIKSELLQRQCTLVMPPFALEPQFTREEVLEGYSIASVRIHIKRAIQRVKTFKILKHINVELFDRIDDIMFLICVLANNKEPLIKKK